MKRLISISLAVLLVASLGIMMFPSQLVYAHYPFPAKKTIFNITAKGQGDYTIRIYPSPPTNGTGEFSIRIAGEVSHKGGGLYGEHFAPDAEVGGHISGSFDGHKINVGLQGNLVHFGCECDRPLNLIHVYGLRLRGNYDGNPIKTASNKSVSVYYNDDGIKTIEVFLPNFPGPNDYLRIWMYETGEKAADTFNVDIREVGH